MTCSFWAQVLLGTQIPDPQWPWLLIFLNTIVPATVAWSIPEPEGPLLVADLLSLTL